MVTVSLQCPLSLLTSKESEKDRHVNGLESGFGIRTDTQTRNYELIWEIRIVIKPGACMGCDMVLNESREYNFDILPSLSTYPK